MRTLLKTTSQLTTAPYYLLTCEVWDINWFMSALQRPAPMLRYLLYRQNRQEPANKQTTKNTNRH